jgi:RNA polymerase sigma-70 factor (ECF subfamily)
MESDEELYQRTRAGDMGAFDRLYERYEAPLFGFLLSFVQSREDAEELFHEAFMAVLRAKVTGFGTGGFRAWLYRVARNAALNRIRGARRRARALTSLDEQVEVARPDRGLDERQRQRALETAVARLPRGLSEVYRLRASGLSYEEMASVLEIPLGTLKSRMHEMVLRLREELGPWTAH